MVPVILIKVFLSKKYLKILGCLVVLGAMALCFYMLLANVALMDVSVSNNWAISYMSAWIIDFFCTSVLVSAFKIQAFNTAILHEDSGCGRCVKKIMEKDQELTQVFDFGD